MFSFKSTLFTLFGLLLFGFSNLEAQSNEVLHQIAAQYQSTYNVPGLAIALVRSDTFFLGVSGTKQIEKEIPIDEQTPFHIGSNSKAFTAFLAAYLVERDLVSWSDKLMKVVPELNQPTYAAYNEVTLEHLLAHRSGLAPFESSSSKEFRALPKNLGELENSRLRFAQVALSFPPDFGEGTHVYSNAGYVLAALMLERATSSTFEDLLLELGQQLKLNFHFGFPNDEAGLNMLGHRKRWVGRSYRSLAPNNRHAVPSYFAPAGDLAINLDDLAIWVQFHLRGLSGENIFLKPESYEKLHYGLPDYGLGWYNGKIGAGPERFSYHGGSLGTFSSAIMLSAERNTGIVILVNAESKHVGRLKEKLRVELWDRFGQPSK